MHFVFEKYTRKPCFDKVVKLVITVNFMNHVTTRRQFGLSKCNMLSYDSVKYLKFQNYIPSPEAVL